MFECTSGRFGKPKNELGRILYVETRNALLGRPFSIKLSHDLATNDNAVDMPIYLLRDQEAAFTGGLRLGWTNEDHFVAGIFVGKPFDIPAPQ